MLNEKLKQQVFDPRWFGLSTFVQYMYGWKSWNRPVVASGTATTVSGACSPNELYSEASGLSVQPIPKLPPPFSFLPEQPESEYGVGVIGSVQSLWPA